MTAKSASLSLVLFTFVAACGNSPPPPTDGGFPDAHPLPRSRLMGACEVDAQCPGGGAVCRRSVDGYPGGMCTVPCEDRTVCDDGAVYNFCLTLVGETRAYCEAACRNGSDCRPGYTCAGQIGPIQNAGFCVPVCSSDAQCGAGAFCNRYSGRCVSAPPASGAVTGEPCMSDDECQSGSCRPELNRGTPTGYVHGYCDAPCILPGGYNTSNFFSEDTLPAGTCAGNAICIPARNQQGEGDLGTCLAGCSGDGDCREGYGCLQTIQSHTFTNGICVPINCGGAACPAGYRCVAVPNGQGGTNNLCSP